MFFRSKKKQEEGKAKPRTIKYISLYGCRTMNDVQENIAWSFAENARDKIKDKKIGGKRRIPYRKIFLHHLKK